MRGPLRHRFVRDVALTSGTQFVKAALAMVAGIVVARYYGPSARGTVSVLVALGSMTVLLGSLGLHQSSVYFMGRYAEKREQVVSNNMVVGAVGGVVIAVCLLAVGLLLHEQILGGISSGLFAVYVVSVPFLYFNTFAQRIVLGAGRVTGFNIADLVEGSALLVGTVAALALFGTDLTPLIMIRVLVELSIAAALIVYIHRLIRFRFSVSAPQLHEQLTYGLRNYAASLLWLFLLQSDIVLCNYFLGSAQTGVYSVAVSLGLPVTMLASAVGTLIFQRTSAQQSRELRIANTNRALRLLVPLAALPMLVFGLLAGWLVPLIYGDRFQPAATALILLLPGLLAFSLEIVVMNFLAGEGSPPIIYLAPLAGLVLNVAANLYVIPRWGINGAAVTSSVAYTVVLVLVLRYYVGSTGSSLRALLVVRRDDVAALAGSTKALSRQRSDRPQAAAS